MRLILHSPRQRPNPRRAVFGELSDILAELASQSPTDEAGQAQARTRVEAAVQATRARVIDYYRRNPRRLRRRHLTLDELTQQVNSTPMTVDRDIATYDVRMGDRTIHLNPVAPGPLIERPGGFTSSVEESRRGRGGVMHAITARASDSVIEESLGGFSGVQQGIARNYLEVIRTAEGSLSSLNTWDRLRITLGSGLGAAGRLQATFYGLYQNDPESFTRLFGRYGIGVTRHRRGGNAIFTVVDPASGEQLEGDAATEYMANNPALLGALVNAGFDPAWQRQLLSGAVASIRSAFSYRFTVTASERDTNMNLFDLLNGHIGTPLLNGAMFTLADGYHGYGSVAAEVTEGLATTYLELASRHDPHNPNSMPGEARQELAFDPHNPNSMPGKARQELAAYLVRTHSHPPRRRHIARVLHLGSFNEIYGGGE